MFRHPVLRILAACSLLFSAFAAGGGCRTVEPFLDYDLETFRAGVDALIKPGMPYNEARRILLERFPEPKENTESAPMIARKGMPTALRRFTMLWETTTPGVSLVLTIECDRDLNVARWIVGPLYAR